MRGFFYLKLFIMVYLLKCLNDKKVEMKVQREAHVIEISICDYEDKIEKYIYLSKNDVFDLVGILHHIQKQM